MPDSITSFQVNLISGRGLSVQRILHAERKGGVQFLGIEAAFDKYLPRDLFAHGTANGIGMQAIRVTLRLSCVLHAERVEVVPELVVHERPFVIE